MSVPAVLPRQSRMQVAGTVALILPNSYVFNQNLDFLTLTVKDHENQGKVHPFFEEHHPVPLVFMAK